MEYRQLGRTPLQVSSIGLGCVTFGREIDEATSFTILDHALARGINLLDTAEAYAAGASETVVGNWLKARKVRSRVVLCTKVSGHLTTERIVTSAEASLRRLQTDTVDLFQLHRFDPDVPLAAMLEGLHEVVRRGYARHVGCSNFAAWQLAKSLWQQDVHGWSRMESVQPMYNLVDRSIEKELLPLCADQQVGVLAYSPLGAGFLTGKYREGGDLPVGARLERLPGHQPLYFTPDGWRIMEGLRATAQRAGLEMAQLALAWTIRQPGITSVLIGARTTAQVDQAFHAENLELSDELRAQLNRL
jgi:aryl-alcohol dehydrogenase-like predicted oxidoreductase